MMTVCFSGKKKRILTVSLFCVLAAALVFGLGILFQPVWTDWSMYNTYASFYEEPDNTIETIILGPSTGLNAVIPIELYEQYGISAYNLSGERQPLLVSYYWMRGAYAHHQKSLTTVALEISSLTGGQPERFYQKSFDLMRFSPLKIEAVCAYTEGVDDFLNHLIPLFAYHDRWESTEWNELAESKPELIRYFRGYNETRRKYLDDEENVFDLDTPYVYLQPETPPATLDTESLTYAEKIVQFCHEHGLQLILFSTPNNQKRDTAFHVAVQNFADRYELSYLDYSFAPLVDELDLSPGMDCMDHTHLNYCGARKFTAVFGRFLGEECANRDCRGLSGYEHLEQQLEDYRVCFRAAERLNEATDPADYVKEALSYPAFTVILSIRDEAAAALTDRQRKLFNKLGLSKLSKLKKKNSYLAVIRSGEEVKELSGINPDDPSAPLEYQDEFCVVKSGAKDKGNLSSVQINGTEYSENGRGINIVVWDEKRQCLVDAACFDTHKSSWRVSTDLEAALRISQEEGIPYERMAKKVQKLYVYHRLCDHREIREYWEYYGKSSLRTFLRQTKSRKGYAILLAAKGNAFSLKDEKEQKKLQEYGYDELSNLTAGMAYIAVVKDGEIICQKSGSNTSLLHWEEEGLLVASGKDSSGDTASIQVQGQEQITAANGLYAVIVDQELNIVVCKHCFR